MYYLTQKQIRGEFWENHPEFKREGNKKQNEYNATIRSAFVEYVDYLQREGFITEKIADKVTL